MNSHDDLQKQVAYLNNEASKNADLNNRQAIRIAELERKLAEQQAAFLRYGKVTDTAELNTLLAQAREEGRKEVIPDGWIALPLCVVERAYSSLGSFCGDEGWAASDMDNMDSLGAYLARSKKVGGEAMITDEEIDATIFYEAETR